MNPSDELIPTRSSLLSRLKQTGDADSWQEIFDTYWRLIYRAATKSGLTDAEAQEAVQKVVIGVARQICPGSGVTRRRDHSRPGYSR